MADITQPPIVLGLVTTDPTPREMREIEKSALREAIASVCEAAVGERGCKLQLLLDRIEELNGPKAAFDSIIKLLEFAQPKLQRVTVQDPDGQAVKMPVININFAQPPPTFHVEPLTIEPEGEDES